MVIFHISETALDINKT